MAITRDMARARLEILGGSDAAALWSVALCGDASMADVIALQGVEGSAEALYRWTRELEAYERLAEPDPPSPPFPPERMEALAAWVRGVTAAPTVVRAFAGSSDPEAIENCVAGYGPGPALKRSVLGALFAYATTPGWVRPAGVTEADWDRIRTVAQNWNRGWVQLQPDGRRLANVVKLMQDKNPTHPKPEGAYISYTPATSCLYVQEEGGRKWMGHLPCECPEVTQVGSAVVKAWYWATHTIW